MARLLLAIVLLSTLACHAVSSANNQTQETNSSVSCDGANAAEIVNAIKQYNLNVSVLVATCHRICFLALGFGNPVSHCHYNLSP